MSCRCKPGCCSCAPSAYKGSISVAGCSTSVTPSTQRWGEFYPQIANCFCDASSEESLEIEAALERAKCLVTPCVGACYEQMLYAQAMIQLISSVCGPRLLGVEKDSALTIYEQRFAELKRSTGLGMFVV